MWWIGWRIETSESIEAGLRYEGGPIRIDLTAFHSDYDNFISQEVVSGGFTPANPAIYQFVNLDRVEVKGAEARIEGKAGGFTGTLALSYAEGDVIDPDGARSPLSTVLTPAYSAGHRDHFHIDIRPDDARTFVR